MKYLLALRAALDAYLAAIRPVSEIPVTQLSAEWPNTIQRELLASLREAEE